MDAGVGIDAGMDADAGIDAGMDADAGIDAGMDAGVGIDAGMDADAGIDAGISSPDDVQFVAQCGCSSPFAGPAFLLGLLLARRARRQAARGDPRSGCP